MKITIKKATLKDANFIYKLRNEKKNRQLFFNTKYIKIIDHLKWFKKKIYEKNIIFLICLHKKKKIGLLKFDIKKKIANVSIIIIEKYKKRGFGSIFLTKSEKILKKKLKVVASIKKTNVSSIIFFKKNNYKLFKDGTNILKYYKKINF